MGHGEGWGAAAMGPWKGQWKKAMHKVEQMYKNHPLKTKANM